MKHTLRFILLLALVFTVSGANAQVLEDIVEHSWNGSTVSNADFTKSGKVYVTQKFKMRLNRSDYSLSGNATSTVNLDGVKYTAYFTLTGWLYVDENKIYYKATMTSGDELPNGLQWCPSWGYLTFYTNSGKPGYYLLKGTVDDSCGNKDDLELSDY
jgi:hypothetical protein